MDAQMEILSLTALSVGFIHTLIGTDHYLPFIMMKRARNWSLSKTAVITFLCGVGHVMSSVILGFIGIIFGIGIMKLEAFEAFRGNIAAWALIGFGFAYFIWGLHKAIKDKKHTHSHVHAPGKKHLHEHSHSGAHGHIHEKDKQNITPWVLFTIFVLGPCEPLIPILMYPAAKNSINGVFFITLIFGAATIITMMSIVFLSSWGISFVRLGKFEKYLHAIAGGTICLSGLAIQFLEPLTK